MADNQGTAWQLVRQVAAIALPDGMLFAFATYSWLLNGLVDELNETEYPTQYGKFRRIKERYGNGWDTLHMAMNPSVIPSNLTSREFEVASLAAGGLRNSEMALRLVITENTVRAHLRVVFEKLQIDRHHRSLCMAVFPDTPSSHKACLFHL